MRNLSSPISRKNIIIAIAIALGTTSIFGISVFVPISRIVPTVSTVTFQSLELALEVYGTDFVLGKPIQVVISLRNVGNETVAIVFCMMGGKVILKVFDANGTQVYQDPAFFSPAEESFSMPPNSDFRRKITWNQVNYFPEYSSHEDKQVPAGTYKLVGQIIPFFQVYGEPLKTFETPPVTIRIGR